MAWATAGLPSGGVANRKLAGVDDLYTARAANRQPARAVYGVWRTGSSLAWTTSTLHGPPTGSRLRPAHCEMNWFHCEMKSIPAHCEMKWAEQIQPFAK